jgi:hypothetical protein
MFRNRVFATVLRFAFAQQSMRRQDMCAVAVFARWGWCLWTELVTWICLDKRCLPVVTHYRHGEQALAWLAWLAVRRGVCVRLCGHC